jgi:hypothetical protein
MPVSALHHQVAAIALAAASQHGFALGGGNALIAHGIIDRVTQDVDLFTDQEHGVAAAVQAVESALRAAGFRVERAAVSAYSLPCIARYGLACRGGGWSAVAGAEELLAVVVAEQEGQPRQIGA